MSGIFPIDPQADLAPDTAHPGEYYINNFVGDDQRLFAGVWSADAQETLIESYPVDEVCVVLRTPDIESSFMQCRGGV